MANHILIVEDEETILELIRYNLMQAGFDVWDTTNGEDALDSVRRRQPDCIVLDLMLPGLDGLSVCRRLKRDPATAQIPILILTAKGDERDVVTGLEAGADDYVTKPFSPKVLLARVNALLRRAESGGRTPQGTLSIHTIALHPGKREVMVSGIPVELTFTEFEILNLLARHPGWVYTRNQIVEAVRGDNYPVTDRAVDFQIVGLRKKLGGAGKFIETVRGVGYRMKEA
ncbi:MAG: response regulator [Candidatus Marinimicrobia bacterium]|nr:response regulator [Candidatus Neomarinimicrobiota bacterium]MCF7840603.1 response regulator [Candidatus Neomarinimicrobiota bacterium]MCF7903413.1 response regulator [Candidatus Neomarinimicrobiota bacterium]